MGYGAAPIVAGERWLGGPARRQAAGRGAGPGALDARTGSRPEVSDGGSVGSCGCRPASRASSTADAATAGSGSSMSEASGVPALDDVLPLLRCPHCGARLGRREAGDGVRCDDGHTFDVAGRATSACSPARGRPTRGHRRDGGRPGALPGRRTLRSPGRSARRSGRRERRLALPPASSTSAPAPAGTSRACSMRGPGRPVSRSISRSPPCAAPLASIRASRPSPATSGGRFRCGTPWPPWSSTCSPRAARARSHACSPPGASRWLSPQPDHLRELAQPLGLLTVDEAQGDPARRSARPGAGDRRPP